MEDKEGRYTRLQNFKFRVSEALVSHGEKLQVSFVFPGANIETTTSRNGMAYERTGVQKIIRKFKTVSTSCMLENKLFKLK